MYLSFILILVLCETYESARILGVTPTPSYSHQVVYQPIWRELVRRGHEVVVITADPENDPFSKVKEIDVHFSYNYMRSILEALSNHNILSVEVVESSLRMFDGISEQILDHSEVQVILNNKTEQFDIVMSEVWWNVLYGFAERFNCPLVLLSSMELANHFHMYFGNPTHPVAYPDVFSGSDSFQMNFWERLYNTGILIWTQWNLMIFETSARQSRIWNKHFGTKMPYQKDLLGRVSMVFTNVVPTLSHRPIGPYMINMGGGIHLGEPKPLSNDLAEFLDGAKGGAIYVSLGTNVKGEFIPENVRQAFLGAFKELPYKILWKLDVELSDVPKNVKIVNWLPQQDVLRHPNIKAFLFQGGLQSLEETIANKIPVVGIPFISDQETNVRKLVKNGYGLGLNKDTITKESLKEALLEVISNPSYKQAIKRMADIIADQPMTGLEKAVWWTEYVIRHKGAHHLRNPIMDMPAYQYYLLDVIGFCLLVTSILMYVLYKLLSFVKMALFRMLLSPASPNKKQKVK